MTDSEDSAENRSQAAAPASKNVRRCRVDGCNACLMREKKFYRRSRCCQTHARELQVLLDGEPRRFCQQCCGFHELAAFDGNKRSCRERLEAHNTRQREKWTVGGRRRPGAAPASDAAASEPPHDIEMADASASFTGVPSVALYDAHTQGYSVNLEGLKRGLDPSPWDNPPPGAVQAPAGASIGGLSPGSGSPARPPRSRRTLRSKSDKTGVWASAIVDEQQHSWLASGAAVNPRHRPGGFIAGEVLSRTLSGSGPHFGGSGNNVNLFKHNSCDASELAPVEYARQTPLKRLSIDSQNLGVLKRPSLDSRDGSDASATSSGGQHWTYGSAAPHRVDSLPLFPKQQRPASACNTLRPDELGLQGDDEARAFAEQAPDPLWLAQRLVGSGLEAKTRPEYSYGRQFRRASMDSATASLDAAAAAGNFAGLPTSLKEELLGRADAGRRHTIAEQGPQMSQHEMAQAQAFFRPSGDYIQRQPSSSFARMSELPCGTGAGAFAQAVLSDMTLAPGWDTNEGTLASAMAATGPGMDSAQGKAQHLAGGWPANGFESSAHLGFGMGFGDSEELAADLQLMAARYGLASGRHAPPQQQPGLGRLQLAAMGQQLSAPPLHRGHC